MGIRMTTSASALDAFLQRAARKIQENVLKALSKLGDESVVRIRNRSAKESWIDHTGNLRSSIGFAVYEQTRNAGPHACCKAHGIPPKSITR